MTLTVTGTTGVGSDTVLDWDDDNFIKGLAPWGKGKIDQGWIEPLTPKVTLDKNNIPSSQARKKVNALLIMDNRTTTLQ